MLIKFYKDQLDFIENMKREVTTYEALKYALEYEDLLKLKMNEYIIEKKRLSQREPLEKIKTRSILTRIKRCFKFSSN